MRIVPDSTVTFYSGVDIVPGEQHIAMQTEAQRNSYFNSKIVTTVVDQSMVRKDGTLRIDTKDLSPATAFTCNYLSFVNPSWGNKTFYGFILDIDYLNNETLIITWALDRYESWRFEAEYDAMTIERQHVSQADYAKDPYDPSVLEYRTAETLPIGKDVEKPYYDLSTDGVFIGEALCADKGVDNTLGILITFCDMDLAAKDTGHTAPNTPSQKLFDLIFGVTSLTDSPTSFYVLSPSTYDYYVQTHTGATVSRWGYDSGIWDPMIPLGSNRITPPISYIYIDGGISMASESPDAIDQVGKILDWFTVNGLTESIVGIYPLTAGMALFSGATYGAPYDIGLTTARNQNVRNKKLDLYPFSYYRLIAPNGDVKELRMENFKDVQDGGQYAKVVAALDAVDAPSFVVAPEKYMYDGISPHQLSANANTLEGIVFSQFPTLPYVISGWESQKAAIANSIIANNTNEYGYNQELAQLGVYGQQWDAAKTAVDAALDAATLRPIDAAYKSGQSTMQFAGAEIQQNILNNRWAMSEGAYDVALGKDDTAIDDNFKYVKPAYAQNKYFRSNGVGFSNFMHIAYVDILFLKVGLNPDILAKYDDYFDRYGYTSCAIGIPYVIQYMQGSTNTAEIPQWASDDTTYVKTANCTVKNVPMPVAESIAQMFNAGIRFKKVGN